MPDELLIPGIRRDTVGHYIEFRIQSPRARWHDSAICPKTGNQIRCVLESAAQFQGGFVGAFVMDIFEPAVAVRHNAARRNMPFVRAIG